MPVGNLPPQMQNVFATSFAGAPAGAPPPSAAMPNAFVPEKMGLAKKLVGVLAPDAYFDAKGQMDMRNLGGMAASGDVTGARDMALRSGNFKAAEYFDQRYQAMSEQQREAMKPKFGLVGQAADYLLKVPAEQRAMEYQRIAPQLAQLGLDPNALDPSQLTDENLGRAVEMGYQFGGMERPQGPEYFAPMSVIGPDGKPTLVQSSKTGEDRVMDGFAPYEKPQTLSPYQEQQLALQRDRLAFDKTKPRGPQTVVNVQGDQSPLMGKVPDGFSVVPDPTHPSGYRFEPISGSDVANERLTAGTKAFGAAQADAEQFNTLFRELDDAEEKIGSFTAGFAAPISSVGGTPARDLRAKLDTVKALIGFDTLAEMRATSPTGGALGAITEKELNFLQSVRGSLDQAQSPQQLRDTLREVKASLGRLQDARKIAYQMQSQQAPTGGIRASDAVTNADLPPGFEIVQ